MGWLLKRRATTEDANTAMQAIGRIVHQADISMDILYGYSQFSHRPLFSLRGPRCVTAGANPWEWICSLPWKE